MSRALFSRYYDLEIKIEKFKSTESYHQDKVNRKNQHIKKSEEVRNKQQQKLNAIRVKRQGAETKIAGIRERFVSEDNIQVRTEDEARLAITLIREHGWPGSISPLGTLSDREKTDLIKKVRNIHHYNLAANHGDATGDGEGDGGVDDGGEEEDGYGGGDDDDGEEEEDDDDGEEEDDDDVL